MSLFNNPQQAKSYGFGLHAFKRYPEIIPLVGIMGVAVVGVGAFCTYSIFFKTDVQVQRTGLERYHTVDVNQPQKFLTYNQKYGEDPEITALKMELAKAYKN